MIDLTKYVEDLYELVKYDQLWRPLGVVLVATAYIGFLLGGWFARHRSERKGSAAVDSTAVAKYEQKLAECHEQLRIVSAREEKYDNLVKAVCSEEGELWRLYAPKPYEGYVPPIFQSRSKIIVIANNKGGVGKTTLTAALAGYFEKRKGKRVLLIDLDYQGSLSGWMIKAAGISIPQNQLFRLSLANGLIDGWALNHWQPEVLGSASPKGEALQRAQLITSDYTLTDREMRLMLRWLVDGGTPDVRYHIAQTLLSDAVQNVEHGFDVVLIDAPPRLTTSAVGALTAATHLLVPTKLDKLSGETVGSFLKQVWELRAKLNPGLELAGIVGTMTHARPLGEPLRPLEKDALGTVALGLEQWQARRAIFQSDMQDLAEIRKCAGLDNPYFVRGKVQEMFDRLGDELSEKIGL